MVCVCVCVRERERERERESTASVLWAWCDNYYDDDDDDTQLYVSEYCECACVRKIAGTKREVFFVWLDFMAYQPL